MKNNNKRVIKIFMVLCIVAILIVSILYVMRRENYINLTQFSSTTARQMMGYAIKTRDNKIIIIDGGTTDDAIQLKEYINKNRKQSRYMVYNTSTF